MPAHLAEGTTYPAVRHRNRTYIVTDDLTFRMAVAFNQLQIVRIGNAPSRR
jgi:hypothetical protein